MSQHALACVLFLLVTVTIVTSEGNTDSLSNHVPHGSPHNTTHKEHHHVHVAKWNWAYVKYPFIITGFIFFACILKLLYHHAGFLASLVPESCILILLGTGVGAIIHYSGSQGGLPELTPRIFFLFLLPPIILESAYSLHDRVFFDNLGTILVYAVIGTVLNCFIIGPSLYGLARAGAMGPIQITFVQCLAFASLIVAVDPVAVLAIFQEVGVNQVLYFLVFGESLFNDAVTVVLYNTMKTFTKMETIPPEQIALGFAAFFTVSLGGLFIGMFFGFLTALLTRFTGHVRVVEPLAVFVLAYMALLTTEMFHFSGIVSVIGCGLVQAHYAFHNISHKSYTTVKYFIKMMAATNDCLIFLFMGMALVHPDHVWHPGFICWTLLLCLVVRFLVTFGLTFIVNKVKKTIKISYEEQFIMSYGGLRGAVAYCLVAMFDKKYVPQNMFESTTLVVVLFTVFVQGATIKPLVKLFKIRTAAAKSLSMCNEIQDRANDHIVAGIEQVLGHYGTNFFREFFDNVDHKYLKKFFQKNPESRDAEIMALYEKISLKQHLQEVKHITTPTDENENKDKELDEAFENMTKVSGAVALPGKPTVSEKHPDVVLRKSRRGDRASRLKIFSQGQRDFSMIAEPSPQDFRMMALPSSPYVFRKFDRNLTKDSDDKDALVHKLKDKFERQSRWHKVSHGQTVDGAVGSHGPRHMTLDPKLLRAQTTDDVETPHHGKPTTLPHAFTIDMPGGSTAPLSAPPGERDFKFEPIDEVVEPEESDPLVAKQQISRGSKKHGKLERGETIDMPDVMEMKTMGSKQGGAPKSQGSSQAQPGVQKPQQGDPEVQITESSALLQNDKASSDA